MSINRFIALGIAAAGVAMLLTTEAAVATGKPKKTVFRIDHSTIIRAGTPWDSLVRFGEKCAFDLAIDYDTKIVTWAFADHEVVLTVAADKYTNLSTGFTFVDRANFHYYFDYATSRAFFAGLIWKIDVPGPGIEVHDTGTHVHDFSGEYPWPALELTGGPHDVMSKPFGTLSYCDWAEGKFPNKSR